jgi:hypothetical protein
MGWMEWIDLVQERDWGGGGSFCEHDNEPFGSIKMLGSSWSTAHLAFFQEELSSVELVVIYSPQISCIIMFDWIIEVSWIMNYEVSFHILSSLLFVVNTLFGTV